MWQTYRARRKPCQIKTLAIFWLYLGYILRILRISGPQCSAENNTGRILRRNSYNFFKDAKSFDTAEAKWRFRSVGCEVKINYVYVSVTFAVS